MRRLLALAFAVTLFAVASADKPPDTPCVTWTLWNSNENINDINNWYTAAYVNMVGQEGMGCDYCTGQGYVLPCFAITTNTWGHHDYVPGEFPADTCRTNVNGSVYFANNFYLPSKGEAVRTWEWQVTEKGAKVPDNAIRFGPSVMARANNNIPGCCMGQGFTGWAVGEDDGTFGDVYFAISSMAVKWQDFSVAICKAYKPTPAPPTPAPSTTPGPTPVPTTEAPPTLPPNNKPYIRFAHALPSMNNIDATITQGNYSFTWSNYSFGQFSTWNELFEDGFGQITLWENNGGRVEPPLLQGHNIYLTPGPLVVAVKADITGPWWPPTRKTNVETIAASYIPNSMFSGVRLFNLSPDTPRADLYDGSDRIIYNVNYTLGSDWALIPVTQATFTAKDTKTNATLGTVTMTPPNPPFVFTAFLVGAQNESTNALGTRVVPLVDAPEA